MAPAGRSAPLTPKVKSFGSSVTVDYVAPFSLLPVSLPVTPSGSPYFNPVIPISSGHWVFIGVASSRKSLCWAPGFATRAGVCDVHGHPARPGRPISANVSRRTSAIWRQEKGPPGMLSVVNDPSCKIRAPPKPPGRRRKCRRESSRSLLPPFHAVAGLAQCQRKLARVQQGQAVGFAIHA